MKNFLMFILLMACASSYGAKMSCVVEHNSQAIFEESFTLEERSSVTFFKYEQYDFLMSSKVNKKYELEVLDLATPSRSYAISKLEHTNDILEYALWSRDILLEVKCKLLD